MCPPTRASRCEFVRGAGCRLWDDEGNEYLDFLAGISVCNAGHCHPRVVAACASRRRSSCTPPTSSTPRRRCELAERLSAAPRSAGGCSSPTPGRRPTRRRSSSCASASRGGDIVVVHGAFHGRTYGALSATPQETKQAPFAPLVPGFRVVPRDDPGALDAAVDERTAAVLLEPIQGETGICAALRRDAAHRPRGVRPRGRGAGLRRDPDRHGPHRARCGPTSRPGSCPTR